MNNSNIDDYLKKGMYGVKQTKPDERRKFLGTIRERIVVALTKSQVMEKGVYPEVVKLMKDHPKATLLLNGDLDYAYLSDYIANARKINIPFSIVTNKESNTDIGLVLAYDYAIDKEEIYIEKQEPEHKPEEVKTNKKNVISKLIHFLKK
ncbi:YueI family protein [Lederbergia graminis]|uniref:YueI family protein n=1 Tax=Lederbergia graminis TaxID=735518 RepID=A0ABW0LBA3_9BACI|nr:YueI family protein [Paenibacillus bovis]HLU23466.1 YueI family protein [Bacillaceae bacterium]